MKAVILFFNSCKEHCDHRGVNHNSMFRALVPVNTDFKMLLAPVDAVGNGRSNTCISL